MLDLTKALQIRVYVAGTTVNGFAVELLCDVSKSIFVLLFFKKDIY